MFVVSWEPQGGPWERQGIHGRSSESSWGSSGRPREILGGPRGSREVLRGSGGYGFNRWGSASLPASQPASLPVSQPASQFGKAGRELGKSWGRGSSRKAEGRTDWGSASQPARQPASQPVWKSWERAGEGLGEKQFEKSRGKNRLKNVNTQSTTEHKSLEIYSQPCSFYDAFRSSARSGSIPYWAFLGVFGASVLSFLAPFYSLFRSMYSLYFVLLSLSGPFYSKSQYMRFSLSSGCNLDPIDFL